MIYAVTNAASENHAISSTADEEYFSFTVLHILEARVSKPDLAPSADSSLT